MISAASAQIETDELTGSYTNVFLNNITISLVGGQHLKATIYKDGQETILLVYTKFCGFN